VIGYWSRVVVACFSRAVGHRGWAMRKRRVYLVVIGVAAFAFGLLVVFRTEREREPEYQGRPLSYWISFEIPVTNPPYLDERVAAIRQMGTNAFPFLLKWLRDEIPAWKRKFYAVIDPNLKHANSFWQLNDHKKIRLMLSSGYVLRALGPESRTALQGLSEIVNDPSAYASAVEAMTVLASLGKDWLPPLLGVLTNQQRDPMIRWCVAQEIGQLGKDAALCIPAWQQALSDPDRRMRHFATNALLKLDPQALERAGR